MFRASVPTTTVTTSGCRLMALVDTTRTGRSPACSRPRIGFRLTKYTSPRLIILQPVPLCLPEGSLDPRALGPDSRVGGHPAHGLLERLTLPSLCEFLQCDDDDA